jgi:uncharacterized protein
MKDSLDHLPPRQQRQIVAVVNEIHRAAEVEMVILFGSRARGDWVEDAASGYYSDYDLLVIVKSPAAAEKDDVWCAAEQRASRHTTPSEVGLVVHDIAEVNRQLELGYYFFSDIVKEGIRLFDSQHFKLSSPKAGDPEERRRYAKESFETWFSTAGFFFDDFEINLEKGRYSQAAFYLHQATERYYTAVLLALTAYKPKSHNLATMGRRAAALHPALRGVFPQVDAEDARLFKLLKHAYVDARYSGKFVITGAELTVLAGRVRELRDRVERVCKERIEGV